MNQGRKRIGKGVPVTSIVRKPPNINGFESLFPGLQAGAAVLARVGGAWVGQEGAAGWNKEKDEKRGH